MSLYLTLFFEFFRIGLFALGGGLATLPFLQELITKYHWYTEADLMNMIAIGESTPGPIGVNMATYVGFHVTGNVFGAITTTLGLVAPSVIIICIIARALKAFSNNRYVKSAFYGLRPAVSAMIACSGLSVFITTMFSNGEIVLDQLNWISLGLFVVIFAVSSIYKKLHPILLICLCGVLGILLQL